MSRAVRPSSIPRLVSLALVLVVWLVASVPSAVAATNGRAPSPEEIKIRELQAERDRVRAEQAKKANSVDALKASDADVDAALSALSTNLSVTSARLEDAQRAAQQAETEAANAQAAVAQAEAQLGDLKGRIRQQAIEAYVTGGSADQDWSVMSVDNPMDAAQRRVILDVRASRSLDSVEDYRTIQHELATQQAAAEAASARAEGHRTDVTNRLADLKAAQSQQEQLSAQIDDRLDRALAEADGLASVDSTLAGQISEQQTALANRVAAERRAAEAARAALAAAKVRTSSGAGASRDIAAPSFPNTDGAGIVTVQGIQVDSSIAGSLDAMLNAARADGVVLSGGGYRNPAGQIAVRRSNCGSSNYAIYEMPASSCSPPTARPGRSMHEQGLAIDFTQGGRTLNRSSAGFRWLKANAASYGFHNLPSEPWHWSTNGN